ncbi:MAG: hypothetical protein KZQ60_18630 [Candidatus Thiodiazotropha sp. (ex Lucinoma aequizonata)]|nr:hypothetical protein [Candidatus Thiodiazotropha sp. (ex Lucinoma aequizonata)]
MHYSIMTIAMTLRRLGCALCMPFISPFRSPFRPYNRAYAYRELTAFAPFSMAVSAGIYSFYFVQSELVKIHTCKYYVIIQLKNWKKCLTRFFCIFSDFK